MESRKIELAGSRGAPLVARLDLPDGEPRAYALFVHCFTGSEDGPAARISRALTRFGIAVVRFDITGVGGSGSDSGDSGDSGDIGLMSDAEDLRLVAEHLRANFAPVTILLGHSLGGAAVLATAHLLPGVRALATIGAPADPEHALRLVGGNRAEIERRGEAEVVLAGRAFRLRKDFLEDIASRHAGKPGAALLVMHSPTDALVGVDNARRIFDNARHPKSFIALDGAGHLLTKPADAEYVATVLAAWASRYVPALAGRSNTAPEEVDRPAEGHVVVSENGDGPSGQRITAGRHVLTADEPVPIGNDSGPAPYDLLLAALGACTSMTVRMYADRKRWPLDHVTVRLRHSRIHAADCAECETRHGMLDRIDRLLLFDGDLDDDQRRRLLEIAEKCPVHRTLHSEVEIRTAEDTRR